MKLVTRYVVREHVGPLVFALSALTSLLMLQYVARQLANLAGKGLPWIAIAKFFVLSLPFTVAMTLPMAVLVATLYAFGRMAAEHEITAFKASGVRVRSLMAPVLACAFLLSLAMVAFNDQVLPRANHQLRILQQDIARTKPTLALRDQVLNAITEQFYMRVARSDAATNRMWDVVIYDLRLGPERKTIYADSGLFLVAPNRKDLQLMLYSGHSQEFAKGDARRLQRTYFAQQAVQLQGITQNFESSQSDSYKGDREMSICEMDQKYLASAAEFRRIRKEYIMYASRLVKQGTKTVRAPRDRPAREVLAQFYCVTLPSWLGVKAAHAQEARVGAGVAPSAVPPSPAPVTPPAVVPSAGVPAAVVRSDAAQLEEYRSSMLASNQQLVESRESLDSLAVEIHKKFALSFACFVFILFGPPIALRFPRGGVGVTLGVSIVVFGLYYICLMAGEALADKGRLPAYVAMWIANVIFTIAGVTMLWRIESTTDSSRGGGLREWWRDRAVRRALARERATTA